MELVGHEDDEARSHEYLDLWQFTKLLICE
nr:MAG TPA: hypothetical protein [Bacteriophage sp.]